MRIDSLHNQRPAPALHSTRTDTTEQGSAADNKLREVCEQFEAFFTAELLKAMRQSGQMEGLLKRSRAEKIFSAQRDTELCKYLARRGALGIAKLLYEELKPRLESAEIGPEQ